MRAYATLGEIVKVMKDVFGTYEEPTWIYNPWSGMASRSA